MQAGADDYLIKPFSARELLARVGAHLEMARAQAEAVRREQEARAEAERERARLRDIFVQAPAVIVILRGPDHLFETANPRYMEITGARELVGKTVREAFPDAEDQGFFELPDQVYQTGEPFVGNETPIQLDRHGDGTREIAYLNFVYQPIKGADGQVEGIFVHAVDVTDQVRARQQAEEAVRSRDEFLSIAAHELRTPITAIKGTAQIARRAPRRRCGRSTRWRIGSPH
jgi:PAS domain S-box-containing protein